MMTPLKELVSIGINDTPVSRAVRPINPRADHPKIEQHDSIDRKLRNRILLANGLVWVAIVLFLRFFLF
jgi:hypothetical protein